MTQVNESSSSKEYVQESTTNCTVPNIGAELLNNVIGMLIGAAERIHGLT